MVSGVNFLLERQLNWQAQNENKTIKWNGKNLFVNGKEVRASDIPDAILKAV